MFDVCIVGAGPAGLETAAQLIKKGASVAVIEKHIFPFKACGGGLTGAALKILDFSDGALYQNLLVKTLYCQTMVKTPKPYMRLCNKAAWITGKKEELADKGVVFLSGRSKGIKKTEVFLDSASVKAGYVVGADGATSKIRRSLKLGSAVGLMARQVRLDANRQKNKIFLEFPCVWFVHKWFGSGYGWVFPYEDHLLAGVGVPTCTHTASSLKKVFFKWLDHCSFDLTNSAMQSGSIGCNYQGHRFEKIFLAGDAGGFASPLTGEGISQALISGQEVAKEIINPSYRSEPLLSLATAHRRTAGLLSFSRLGKVLYDWAPQLLKIPGIAEISMSKYS